jgi:hypothetical protein
MPLMILLLDEIVNLMILKHLQVLQVDEIPEDEMLEVEIHHHHHDHKKYNKNL